MRDWVVTGWLTVTLVVGAVVSSAAPAQAVNSTPSGLATIAPCVVLDTTQATGGFAGPLAGGESVDVQTTGTLPNLQGGALDCLIPGGVSGVLVNIVALSPTRAGNLRVFPTGEPATGGVVNFAVQTPSLDNSNAVVVPVSSSGKITVEVNAGPSGVGLDSTQVRVTVIGYLSPTGLRYTPVTPCAFADSRTSQGATGGFAGPYSANDSRTVGLTTVFPAGQGGGNSTCGVLFTAQAALVNLVAVNPVGSGEIGVRAAGSSNDATYVSYSQLSPAMNNANAVVVPLSGNGQLDLFSVAANGNSTEVRAVVLGYLSSIGDDYVPMSPCAAFDSRSNQGATGAFLGAYDGGESRTFRLTGTFPAGQGGGNTDCGIPSGATAALVNVVAVNPQRAGNLRATATGTTPSGGIVNFAALSPAMNNSNAVVVPLSANGDLDVSANGGAAGVGQATAEVRGVVLGYFQRSTTNIAAEVTSPISFAPPDFLPASSPVTISGNAYNPDGVDEVRITVIDQVTGHLLLEFTVGQYFFTGQLISHTFPVSLGSPGADSSTWSFGPIDLEASGGSGRYSVSVWVNGQANGAPIAIHSFATTSPSPPTLTYEAPSDGAVVANVAIARGTADDEEGIALVHAFVSDVATGQYLSELGGTRVWVAGRVSIPALYNPATAEWALSLHGPNMPGRTIEVEEVIASDYGGSSNFIFPAAQITIGTDTTAPQVAITVPVLNQLLPEPSPTLRGSASDLAGIDSVELELYDIVFGSYWNGTTWTGIPSWFEADLPGTAWSNVDWAYTLPDTSPQPFGSGQYRLSARATDISGLVSSATTPFIFATVIDTDGPVITIDTPSGTTTAPFTAEGTATDGTGVQSVVISVMDVSNGNYWTGFGWSTTIQTLETVLSSPSGSSTGWSLPVFQPNEQGGSGNYTITATAIDLGSNVTVGGPMAFVVDTIAPIVTFTNPIAGAGTVLGSPNVTFKGTASDAVGLDVLEVEIEDLGNGKWFNGSTWTGSEVSFPVPFSSPGATSAFWSIALDLSNGSGSYRTLATMTDLAGNSGQSALINFEVDQENPNAILVLPGAGSTVFAPVTVSGTADDDTGVDSVEIRIFDPGTGQYFNGSIWVSSQQWLTTTLAANGNWNRTGLTLELAGGSGSYQVRARATDEFAKTGFSSTRSFVVNDVLDPVVTVSDPTEGGTSIAPVLITGTATDNRVVSSVDLTLREYICGSRYFNGTSWQTSPTSFAASITSGTGTGSVNWSSAPALTTTGGCGQYFVTATATDSSALSADSDIIHFTLDTQDPSIAMILPIANTAQVAPFTISASKSDDLPGPLPVTFQIRNLDTNEYWNGSSWQSSTFDLVVTTILGGSYELPASAVANGARDFGVTGTVTDQVGRQTTTGLTKFTVIPNANLITLSPTAFSSRPLTLTGTADSIDEVVAVEIRITELGSSGGAGVRFWNGATWTTGSAPWISAGYSAIDIYGGTWSYTFDPGDASRGLFEIDVRLIRGNGQATNLSPGPAEVSYFPGLTAPTIVSPTANQSLPLGNSTYLVKIKNDIVVLNAEYEMFNTTTGQWRTETGWSTSAYQLTPPPGSVVHTNSDNWAMSFATSFPPASWEFRARYRTLEGWSPWSLARSFTIQ